MTIRHDEPGALRSRVLHPATLLSAGAGVLLLVALGTRTGIDWGRLADAVRASHPLMLVAAFGVYYLNFPLRGLRWRALAMNAESRTDAQPHPMPSARAYSEAVFLGWFVNAVSWFRMGDPYRAYLISRQRGGTSYAATLGTLIAERVIDLIAFAALLLVAGALVWAGEPDLTTAVIAIGVVAATGGVLMVVGMAVVGPAWGRRLPPPFRGWYERLHQGTLDSLRGRLPQIVGLSIAAWGVEAARLALVTAALGLSLPFPAIVFIALAHNLITALPATPGGLGLAEAGMLGLLVLWLPLDEAAALTLLDRSITYLSVLVLGGVLFGWREGVKRGRY